MKILDCSLRDGGYQNNWQFHHDFARDLYQSLTQSKIDIVELGFLYPEKENLAAGYFKCLSDEKIEFICEQKTIDIAVMIDYGKFKPKLLDASNSWIDLVRIATHKETVFEAIELGKQIKDKGYKVSVQLMNTLIYSESEIHKVLKKASEYKINYCYIADSFGSMMPKNIESFIDIFHQYPMSIGVHMHNNIELAFANSIIAIEKGVDIVDCTILGLGRGKGNLRTELILYYLEKLKYNFSVEPVLKFIEQYKSDLFKYKIKDDIHLITTGMMNMHPNYGIEAIEKKLNYLDTLKKIKQIKNNIEGYKKDLL